MKPSRLLDLALFLAASGMLLMSTGHVGILRASARAQWVMVMLPDPPSPLPFDAEDQPAKAEAPKAPPLKLDLKATQDAWVEVVTDRQPAFAKLLRAGQTLSFEASESIRLITGNAAGLQLRLNGEPVAAQGSVRTIEFTKS